ncbi:MAG: TonB family protein [Myxococcales bacterium]
MRESGNSQHDERRKVARRRESGLAALVDFARSMPGRLRRPETLLMLLAMLASLGAHMPPWVGLGALRDYFDRIEREKAKHAPLPPAEVSFEVSEPEKPKDLPEPPKPKDKPKPEEKQELAEPEKPRPEEPKPEEPKPEQPVAQLDLQQQPPPPPPENRRKQSITQKSDDPNVEPPPDAKYLAEESRRVEEETVASITDEHHDDPEPNAAAPQAAGPEESGDAHKDEKGADKGADKENDEKQVAAVEKTPQMPAQPPQQPTPQPSESKPARPAVREIAPQPEAPAPTVVHDPMGTFVLAPASPGQAARKGQDAQAASTNAQKIKVSWSAFEATFGAERLAQDRLPKEAKRRGAGREKRWEEFRAAIENYIVGAKPGNTTALNAAADPFAAYLAAFHRNLHAEFAHEFLASLPAMGELADTSLVTKVEIVLNSDGSLDRVGVVKSSGNMMYDFGAFNAVQRGAPYPVPPEKIRSPDGRVYIVWALRRDESQCGTWNAEPYILKNPPRSPNDPRPDNVSPYRPAAPTGGDPRDAEHGRAPVKLPEQAPKFAGTLLRMAPAPSGKRSPPPG